MFIKYADKPNFECSCGALLALAYQRSGEGGDIDTFVPVHDMPIQPGCEAHMCPDSHMSV